MSGRRVALFFPLSSQRFSAPWRPIGAIDPRAFPTVASQLVAVVANEITWILLPSMVLVFVHVIRNRYKLRKNPFISPSS